LMTLFNYCNMGQTMNSHLIKTISILLPAILYLSSANQNIAQAQTASLTHKPEVWYMGMNDREKPNLFMKRVDVGDTVLVLHGGFGAEHSYLLNLVEPLTDDYHFVLFDQRGSLRSPTPDSLLSFQHLLEDIEWIRQELKLEKLTLLGHSMGTRLVMAYADAYPAHVRNLILVSAVDPALRIPEEITDMSQLPPPKFRLATMYLQTRPAVEKTLQEHRLSLNNDMKNLDYNKGLTFGGLNLQV